MDGQVRQRAEHHRMGCLRRRWLLHPAKRLKTHLQGRSGHQRGQYPRPENIGGGVRGAFPSRARHTGDLYCRVEAETPVALTTEQKELLRQFETLVEEGGERHSPRARSWRDGIRKFFENLGA